MTHSRLDLSSPNSQRPGTSQPAIKSLMSLISFPTPVSWWQEERELITHRSFLWSDEVFLSIISTLLTGCSAKSVEVRRTAVHGPRAWSGNLEFLNAEVSRKAFETSPRW